MSKQPKPKELKAARVSRDRMAEILGEEFTVTVETNKGEVTLGFLRGDKFCMGLSVPSANSELGLQTVAQLVRLKLAGHTPVSTCCPACGCLFPRVDRETPLCWLCDTESRREDRLIESMNERIRDAGRFSWERVNDEWALTCDIGPVAWYISREALAKPEAQDALVKKVLWLKGVLD